MKAKLQKKFITIVMLSLVIIIFLFIIAINGINIMQMQRRMDDTIKLLSDNRGKFPKPEKNKRPNFPFDIPIGLEINEETQFTTRYFLIEYNKDYDVKQINTSNISAVSSEDALEYAEDVIESGKIKGYEGIYRYAVLDRFDGYTVIFMDCSQQLQSAIIYIIITVGVGVAILLLLFIPVSIFSKKAVAPIIDSMEKQKAFIADAGHEIKTPLAIISANADVLELTSGKNEWVTSIRNQTVRLDKLVKNLLTLTKMDQGSKKVNFKNFDVSMVVNETAESFLPVAEAKKKKYEIQVEKGIELHGDEEGMIQLVSTLIDNAMKYSDEEGSVKVQLSKYKKGMKLEVFNTTNPMKEYKKETLDKLFNRFYRADDSRARETGGYGIGLSIARSIVEVHHGKIYAKSVDGRSIRFIVIL